MQATTWTHDALVDRVIGEFWMGVELFFVLSGVLSSPLVAAWRG